MKTCGAAFNDIAEEVKKQEDEVLHSERRSHSWTTTVIVVGAMCDEQIHDDRRYQSVHVNPMECFELFHTSVHSFVSILRFLCFVLLWFALICFSYFFSIALLNLILLLSLTALFCLGYVLLRKTLLSLFYSTFNVFYCVSKYYYFLIVFLSLYCTKIDCFCFTTFSKATLC